MHDSNDPAPQPGFSVITTLAALQDRIAGEAALLAYFSTPQCRVCESLRPKLALLLDTAFPRMTGVYIDCEVLPEAAAQFQVFAVPTLIVFFDGRETLRKGRGVGIEQLRGEIGRIYALRFD